MSKSSYIKDEEEGVSPVIATILMVAITVVLSGVLYTWASELANTQPSAVPLNNYAVENVYEPSQNGLEDRLLRLSFPSGPEDLKWSFVTIALFEEIDSKSYKCSPTSEKCLVTEETPDSVWASNEIITISENGEDICVFGNDCNLVVSIQYQGKSIAGDTSVKDLSTKTLAESCQNNPLCTISYNDNPDSDSEKNYGHYGIGGDDSELWEPNLEWTCENCNGKDLADADTINGVEIDENKGIIYFSETKETSFNVGVPTWRAYSSAQSSLQYGQFISEAKSATECEDLAIQSGMSWDGEFSDADLHEIATGCYIVGNGVYEWQQGELGSTKYGHYGVGGDDTEFWEQDLEWNCNSCNGKDLSDASSINGIIVDINKGILYDLENLQTIVNSIEPSWRAFSSPDNSGTSTSNYGHYGPGGDDTDLWEPNLVWTCQNCNGKDLSDALTINGANVDVTKGIVYDIQNKITYLNVPEMIETTNFGHNGPGGDESELWEVNLEWTCIACNGKDLSDASSIEGTDIDSSKGVLYNLESKETSFNVDEPENDDPNLIWRQFGAYHESLVWRPYSSIVSSSTMAANFYESLIETFLNGDDETFYSYFENDEIVLFGGQNSIPVNDIRYSSDNLCPGSQTEYCHPVGEDYSGYTMTDFNSDYDIIIRDSYQILNGDCGITEDGMSEEETTQMCTDFFVNNLNWASHFGEDDYFATIQWAHDGTYCDYDNDGDDDCNWLWDDIAPMVISYEDGEWKISWWIIED